MAQGDYQSLCMLQGLSSFGHRLHMWCGFAWFARGGGSAKSVTDEAMIAWNLLLERSE